MIQQFHKPDATDIDWFLTIFLLHVFVWNELLKSKAQIEQYIEDSVHNFVIPWWLNSDTNY